MIDNDPKIAFEKLFGTNIDIHWYGIIIAFALLFGVVLGVIEAKRRGFRAEMVLDFMLLAIPLAIIGARAYYVVSEWAQYSDNLWSVFAIWNGGLAIYGAVIGGVVAAFIFYKWQRVRIGTMMDIAAPSLVIAQAIGRWGNFVNQEAFGRAVTNLKWQFFPFAVNIETSKMANGVLYEPGFYMATFFYESVWNVLVFIVLMLVRKRVKIRGGIFALYLIGYGFGRFWIESLRTDSLWWGPFRASQLLSAVLVIGAIAYMVIMSRSKKEITEYKGIYDASLSPEEVKELRANSKQLRAQDQAEKAAKKAEALGERNDAADAKVKKAQAKADKAKKKLEEFETEIKLSEIKAQVDDTATEKEKKKAEKAKEKIDKLTDKTDLAKEKIEKVDEKLQKAEEKARKAEFKAKEAEEKMLKKQARAKKAEIAADKAAEKAAESKEDDE